jgi:hypothetical protein
MKRVMLAALVLSSACAETHDSSLGVESTQPSALSGGIVRVSNPNADGVGSFAAAIEIANADASVKSIQFAPQLGTINLQQPLVFSGQQELTIHGHGNVVDGQALPASATAFTIDGGGNISIQGLTVRNAPDVGIAVVVPDASTGTLAVTLRDVHVHNSGGHGVIVNDQAEYFDNPDSEANTGSAVSLDVQISASTFTNNGFTALDRDGVRLNEGGAGNLKVSIVETAVEGNGGDGVELDERGAGDVFVVVQGTHLDGNGAFSPVDFDDGLDIDEFDDGSIYGSFLQSTADHNFEQGLDFNENGRGDLRIDLQHVQAIGNHEEGIEYEEDDDFAGGGDIVARLVAITARNNGAADGDAGVKLREKGEGNLSVEGIEWESSENSIGGILLREDAGGSLRADLSNIIANKNGSNGIEFDENGAGDFDGSLRNGTITMNALAGVRADQASPGTGELRLTNVTAHSNVGGPLNSNGVIVQQK